MLTGASPARLDHLICLANIRRQNAMIRRPHYLVIIPLCRSTPIPDSRGLMDRAVRPRRQRALQPWRLRDAVTRRDAPSLPYLLRM